MLQATLFFMLSKETRISLMRSSISGQRYIRYKIKVKSPQVLLPLSISAYERISITKYSAICDCVRPFSTLADIIRSWQIVFSCLLYRFLIFDYLTCCYDKILQFMSEGNNEAHLIKFTTDESGEIPPERKKLPAHFSESVALHLIVQFIRVYFHEIAYNLAHKFFAQIQWVY